MAAADFLDIVWPRRCEICQQRVDRPGRHICSGCLMRIPFYPMTGCCPVCGKIITADDDVLCGECRSGNRPHFDRVANALLFNGEARRMVIDYKFNQHLWMRDDFTDWLEAAVNARLVPSAVDIVIPMPLTLPHRFDRGFNQCEYLAKALAKRLRRKSDAAILSRVGAPRRQAGLARDERLSNVAGTFAVANPGFIEGRTILLLDDVMTTGATLSEAAKTLKKHGAWRVWALSLARTLSDI